MMSKNKTFTLMLTVVILAFLIFLQPVNVKAQTKTIVVPIDYSTVQAAVNNASPGDTVFVRSGIYNQSVSIDKSINLIGENPQTTMLTMPELYNNPVFPGPPATYVININANNVNISNFTINNPNTGGAGINSNGNENQINNITLNFGSINAKGAGIITSGSYQYISQNYIDDVGTAIQCSGSYNQIIGNTISNSSDVSLSGSHNIFTDNYVPIEKGTLTLVYFEDVNSNFISNNTLSADVSLQNGDSNTIYDNKIEGSLYVGQVGSASSNLIAKNMIEGSTTDGAIIMFSGSNNEFYGNLVINNSVGLALGATGIGVNQNNEYNNVFFYNMFIENSEGNVVNRQVVGSNSFDNGSVGNYWDNYLTKYPNSTEVDNSGVGNTPYQVYGNIPDNYPLIAPFDLSSISIEIPAWINSLSTPLPMPTFPPQNLLSSQTNSSSSTPTPTIPDFPTWVILPLFALLILLSIVFIKKRIPKKTGTSFISWLLRNYRISFYSASSTEFNVSRNCYLPQLKLWRAL